MITSVSFSYFINLEFDLVGLEPLRLPIVNFECAWLWLLELLNLPLLTLYTLAKSPWTLKSTSVKLELFNLSKITLNPSCTLEPTAIYLEPLNFPLAVNLELLSPTLLLLNSVFLNSSCLLLVNLFKLKLFPRYFPLLWRKSRETLLHNTLSQSEIELQNKCSEREERFNLHSAN